MIVETRVNGRGLSLLESSPKPLGTNKNPEPQVPHFFNREDGNAIGGMESRKPKAVDHITRDWLSESTVIGELPC